MEYAKDEIFNIKYNEKSNTLEFENRTSLLKKWIQKNAWIKIIILITAILSITNFVCIYNFYTLLSSL